MARDLFLVRLWPSTGNLVAMSKRLGLVFTTLLTFFALHEAEAQRYRYIDGSGGIHFVDSLKAVPREYREQIVPPTPTPVLDARAKQQLRIQQENQIRMQQRQQEMRRRELETQRLQAERIQSSKGRSLAPRSGQSSGAAGEIEVIR
jgi:hypothetical protein